MKKSKLTDEQKQQCVKLLTEGWPAGKVADMVGCHRNTVSRIKKELSQTPNSVPAEEACESPDVLSHIKYSTKLKKIQDRVEKEVATFEDPEEGWIISLSVEQYKSYSRQSGMWWSGIAYPDSSPEGWEDRLAATGCQLAISPLHDKDLWEHDSPENLSLGLKKGELYKKGDRKKAHWHFIIKFDTRTSWKEVQELVRPITSGPYLVKCQSLRGYYEYFIHLNHPNRYQYDRDEIREFNNFVIEANSAERKQLFREVCEVIEVEQIENVRVLNFKFMDSPEYMNIIGTRAFYLGQLMNQIWRDNHPEDQGLRRQQAESLALIAKGVEQLGGKKNE